MAYIVMAYIVVVTSRSSFVVDPSEFVCDCASFDVTGTKRARRICDIGIADGMSEAVILSTGTPIPAQWTCRRQCQDRGDISSMIWWFGTVFGTVFAWATEKQVQGLWISPTDEGIG